MKKAFLRRYPVWEVWQEDTIICSKEMKLTRWQALNKVENERRLGIIMEARPARKPAKNRVLTHLLKPGRRHGRTGDSEYFEFLHSLGYCAIAVYSSAMNLTACRGPFEVAHVGDRGLGQKGDHRESLLICRGHHQENRDSVHRMQAAFWPHHGLDWARLVARFQHLFETKNGAKG